MQAQTVAALVAALLLLTPAGLGQTDDNATEDGNVTSPPPDESGNDAILWLAIVAALVVLIYLYGRNKKPEQ